jgi:hypothetical protein
MRKSGPALLGALCVLLIGADAAAASQYVYPSKGQGASKQAKDEADCSKWATTKTGYDPAHPPAAAKAEPAKVTGSGARVKGAAAGAVIGGVSGGSALEGAAAGAVVGGVARRVRNRRAASAQNEAAAQQASAAGGSYFQARGACLSGRGYSVK